MFKYSIEALGCKVNTADAIDIERTLEQNGGKKVAKDADVFILLGCIVTEKAETKTSNIINKVKKNHPNAKIYIGGCKPTRKLNETFEYLEDLLNEFHEKSVILEGEKIKSREFVKIQEGCDNACTYCIIRIARGKSRSFNEEEILNKIKAAEKAYFFEVVLVGTNIGQYGNLVSLLKNILERTKHIRIRLSSLHPDEVSHELVDLIANSNGRICEHFHLSVQSPITSILKDMKRSYSGDTVSNALMLIDSKCKFPFIGMDLITGYPTETDETFNETVEFLKKHPWSKLHVFPFSKRKGTEAFDLEELSPKILNKRSEMLRDLSDKRLHEKNRQQIGRNVTLISEGFSHVGGKNGILGYGESYYRIFVPQENLISKAENGEKIQVKIIDADELYLIAKEIK